MDTPARNISVACALLVLLLAFSFAVLRPDLHDITLAQEGYRISIDQISVQGQPQNKVVALVSVFDPGGRPVPGITEFNTFIDGTRVPVESASSVINQQTGISILLLIDISGSMQGEKLAQAQAAASTFVQGLLPQDIAAIMPFAGSVAPTGNFAPDRNAIQAQINGLVTEPGGTALYQAIARGIDIASQAPTAGRVIVLLTDGQESGASQIGRDEALNAAAASNIPIYAIGLGADADQEVLQAAASATHGSFYQAPAPTDLGGIFNTISARLRSQYEIVVPIPSATVSSRVLAIETRVGQVTLRAEHDFTTTAVPIVKPDSKSGSSRWIWLAVVAAFALPIVVLVSRRIRRPRRHAKSPVAGGPSADQVLPAKAQHAQPAARTGRLAVIEGPSTGQSALVSAAAIDIGSDPGCDLRLETSDAVAGHHARVWLQHDRLVVHRLRAGLSTNAGGTMVEWASLENNETLQLGPHILRFSLDEPDQSAE